MNSKQDSQWIDLRSDTVTRPVPAMREAMACAEVGDDVYKEDPTTNALEILAAETTGKQAALFVNSGSMGNLLALYIAGGRGNEVLAHAGSHIIEHEVGSAAAIAGVLPRAITPARGKLLTAEDFKPYLHPEDYTLADPALIEIENTMGGNCYMLEDLKNISELAGSHGLRTHLDGARLFNAAVATSTPVTEICGLFDSVTFCLSKGLGAPVGSMLCGTRTFIDRARKIRKMLGGGMRQTGILAAAGIYALENHITRLAEDHEHAKSIAAALAIAPWAEISPAEVETNIIFFHTTGFSAAEVVTALHRRGILCSPSGPNTIRMVTHLDISGEAVSEICRVIRELDMEKEYAEHFGGSFGCSV